jgi:hypothetical protein
VAHLGEVLKGGADVWAVKRRALLSKHWKHGVPLCQLRHRLKSQVRHLRERCQPADTGHGAAPEAQLLQRWQRTQRLQLGWLPHVCAMPAAAA